MRLFPTIAIRLALALLAAYLLSSASPAAPNPSGPADRIELVIEPFAARPFPGEMVLLTLRTTLFQGAVAVEELKQPALENFAWIQLAPDHWFSTEIDGVQARRFERSLALFPVRSGLLTIDPFVHRLTVTDDNNRRRTMDLPSTSVQLDVQAWTAATGGPDAADSSWLPAKSLTVTDIWKPDPNRIPGEGTAERTVIIEADGLTADRLPPAPRLRSPGVITFAHPVERKTLLSPAGPIARAIYRWDIRPATQYAATLHAIPIPWFDTTTRRMRQAMLPARQIAFFRPDVSGPFNTSQHLLLTQLTWPLSAVAGFVVGLAMILIGWTDGREPSRAGMFAIFKAWRQTSSLRHFARVGDAYRFRAAVCELARREPQRSQSWLAARAVVAGLTTLDLHLFGAGSSEQPDLSAIAAAIRHSWLSSDRDKVDAIAPLDGSRLEAEAERAGRTACRMKRWLAAQPGWSRYGTDRPNTAPHRP